MIIKELSDLNGEIDINLLDSPNSMQWTYLNWHKGDQLIVSSEQAIESIVLQEVTTNSPLEPMDASHPDYDAEMKNGQVNHNFVMVVEGELAVTRFEDEMLGLREINFVSKRGDTRCYGGSPVPLVMNGIISKVALVDSVHSCLAVSDMDEYKYEGKYHMLTTEDTLAITKSDDKTWVFISDGMIMIDDTPYLPGTYLELLSDEELSVLDDNTIILVLNRLGKHNNN